MTYEMYHVLFKLALRRISNIDPDVSLVSALRYQQNSLWLRRIDQVWLDQWALMDAVHTFQTTVDDPYE